MSKDKKIKEMPGTLEVKKARRSFGAWLNDVIDSGAYWFALAMFSVIGVAGCKMYLGGADPMIANVASVSFVGLLFYITIKLR